MRAHACMHAWGCTRVPMMHAWHAHVLMIWSRPAPILKRSQCVSPTTQHHACPTSFLRHRLRDERVGCLPGHDGDGLLRAPLRQRRGRCQSSKRMFSVGSGRQSAQGETEWQRSARNMFSHLRDVLTQYPMHCGTHGQNTCLNSVCLARLNNVDNQGQSLVSLIVTESRGDCQQLLTQTIM